MDLIGLSEIRAENVGTQKVDTESGKDAVKREGLTSQSDDLGVSAANLCEGS